MALSGSVSSSSYDGRYLNLSWKATQDIATNKSTISWTLSAAGGDDSYYYDGPITVKIAGTTVYYKEGRTKRYKGTISSGTITLTHGTDGTKSFSVSISAAIYTYAVNCSGSKTFTLNQIPRAANFSSADNFTDEDNPIIKYSNPAGSVVSKIEACIANSDGSIVYVPYRDISLTETSYTFELTEEDRETLRLACTTSNSMTVRFYLRTTLGSNIYTNYLAKTLTIINATPTMSPTVFDIDESIKAITGNENAIVKYYSNAQFAFNAVAYKHATIASYNITCGTKSAETETGVLAAVESGSFIFTITDSRGNTVSQTIEKTLVDYAKITCTLDYESPLADGSVILKFSGNYFNGSFGAVANSLRLYYRLKKNGGEYEDWIEAIAEVSYGNNYTYSVDFRATGLDYKSTYEIQATAEDVLNSATSNSIIVKFLPVFDWGEEDFNFNVPISFLGVPMVDYIVEQGFDGIWHWRKWSSGVAELWGQTTYTQTAAFSAWGTDYVSAVVPAEIYPIEFTEIPMETIFVTSPSGSGWVLPYNNTITETARFQINRPAAGGANTVWRVNYIVKGKWKTEEEITE